MLRVLRSQWALWLEAESELNDTRRANLCLAILIQANLESANLTRVNLQGATLYGVNLQGAVLAGADLQNVSLINANLQKANLGRANFQSAGFIGEGNLQSADLREANLQGADLAGANLQSANLGEANLTGAIYEPTLESLPHIFSLLDTRLEDMVFHTSPAALLALREAFKKAGMRTQERQLTYAVKHSERLQAWDPSIKPTWRRLRVPFMTEEAVTKYLKNRRPWLERLVGKSESLFNYALFELPSGYGLAPAVPSPRSGF